MKNIFSSGMAALPRMVLLCLACVLVSFSGAQARSESNKKPAPQRIVALGGDITEIVFALGASGRLVGVDFTSTYPPEASKKPVLGYLRALNAEGILAQNPDIVLASADAGPPLVFKRLHAAGVRLIRTPSVKGSKTDVAETVSRKIMLVAKALQLEEKGRLLTKKFQTAMGDVKLRVRQRLKASEKLGQGVQQPPRILFVLSLRDGAPMAAGRKTGADTIITLAGGENVFADHEGYKLLSLEAAIVARPDGVAMMNYTLAQAGGPEAVARLPAIAATPAGENGRILAMDGNELLGFGPRLPYALERFSAMIFAEPKQGSEARTTVKEQDSGKSRP